MHHAHIAVCLASDGRSSSNWVHRPSPKVLHVARSGLAYGADLAWRFFGKRRVSQDMMGSGSAGWLGSCSRGSSANVSRCASLVGFNTQGSLPLKASHARDAWQEDSF